jgi:hypothetical protein
MFNQLKEQEVKIRAIIQERITSCGMRTDFLSKEVPGPVRIMDCRLVDFGLPTS